MRATLYRQANQDLNGRCGGATRWKQRLLKGGTPQTQNLGTLILFRGARRSFFTHSKRDCLSSGDTGSGAAHGNGIEVRRFMLFMPVKGISRYSREYLVLVFHDVGDSAR